MRTREPAEKRWPTKPKSLIRSRTRRGSAGAGAPARDGGRRGGSPTVATLEGRIAELTDRLLRAHAEMDNLRKRTERDKEETAKYAITKFARDVLSVGDNLQRAIAAVPPGAADADPALKALIDGVAMTEREFLNVLERNGVKRIDPEGEPFNPHQHQAMTEVENREVAAGNDRSGVSAGLRARRPRAAPGDGGRGQGRREARQAGKRSSEAAADRERRTARRNAA